MRQIICATNRDNFGDGGICAICRRRSDGIGEYRKRPESIVWACYEHLKPAKRAAHMPSSEYDYQERRQLEDTAKNAGQYLDAAGIVMTRQKGEPISWEEWQAFIRFSIDNFGDGLAERITRHEAPF